LAEVGAVGLDGELHDSGGEVVHVERVDELITTGVIGGTDVDDLPVEGAWEGGEALESDVEAEAVENLGWVVFDYDVVDVNLCHLARFFKNYYIVQSKYDLRDDAFS
jgi:hypothetical protein